MTIAQFRQFVVDMGASLDASGERHAGAFVVDAPLGKVWDATGSHSLVWPFENECGQRWKAQAIRDAVRDMRFGTSDCDDTACDYCEERRAEI